MIKTSKSNDDDTVNSSVHSQEKEHQSTLTPTPTSSTTPTTPTPTSTSTTSSTTSMPPPPLPNLRRRLIRSKSAPVRTMNNRRSKMFEEHYKLDKGNKALLPGVPAYDKDLARDLHDFFNLIVLVPIVVLNALNWDWDSMLFTTTVKHSNNMANDENYIPFVHAWTGEYFTLFFWSTVAYFISDLLWVTILPKCVKSPSTIIQHHIAVLLYVIIPYHLPKVRFLMGVCMSVELNTWFLIARRVFNKQGFSPWKLDIPYFLSVRVKLISIFFYITWIMIRCVLYPYVWYLLAFPLLASEHYLDEKNAIRTAVFLQTVFCILNAQWTLQLFNSKLKQWRSNGETMIASGL